MRFIPAYMLMVLCLGVFLFLGGVSLQRWFSSRIEERTGSAVAEFLDSYVRTIDLLESQYQMVAYTVLDGLQRIFVADRSAADIPRMELGFFMRRMENRLAPEAPKGVGREKMLRYFTLDAQRNVVYSSLPETLPPIPPSMKGKCSAVSGGGMCVSSLYWSPEEQDFYQYGYWVFPDQSILGVAVRVNRELLAQVKLLIHELDKLPFVEGVHLYSLSTGASLWTEQPPLSREFVDRFAGTEEGLRSLPPSEAERGQGAFRSLFMLWKGPGREGNFPLDRDVIIQVQLDFTALLSVVHQGVFAGFLLLLLGTFWMIYGVFRTSSESVRPFHSLVKAMEGFLEDPTAFSNTEELDERAPLEVHELTRSFQNMGREIAAGMEELKSMNEELEDLYMSREKLAGRLEHVISLAVSLSSARDMSRERYMNRILALAVDMLPGTESGIVGVLDGEEVRILSGVGVDVSSLEDLSLKPDHVVFRGATVSFALMMDRWPQDLRRRFARVCPGVAEGLMVNLRAGGKVLGFLAVDRGEEDRFFSDAGRVLDALASLASGFLGMQQLLVMRGKFQEDLLRSIISILEMYDSYTSGHSENVARISRRIASSMGLTMEQVEETYWAGFVHDVGKLLIPKEILNKTGPLSPEEREVIQTHPAMGRDVLSQSSDLREISLVVAHHHERWDGNGYPGGLAGRDIPLLSRILAVADSYDAMTSDRAYRKGISPEEARVELRKNAGSQFDPQVVDAFLSLEREEFSSLKKAGDSPWKSKGFWEEEELLSS